MSMKMGLNRNMIQPTKSRSAKSHGVPKGKLFSLQNAIVNAGGIQEHGKVTLNNKDKNHGKFMEEHWWLPKTWIAG